LCGGALEQGKPSVAHVRSNSSGNTAFYLTIDTDVVTLTFDLFTPKINEFPGLIVEYLHVEFGDISCIGF